MHILMVTNNYSPYSGGVVSSINATVGALQEQGHQVTLVTLDFLGAGHNDPAWVKRLVCPIKFRYKKNHMAVVWRANKQIKQIIAEIKPDVVHVHHPFLLGRVAARIAKNLKIPTVFTYHTIYEAYVHYVCLPECITKYLVKRRVLSFCRFVDGIIAPSSAIKTYLEAEKIKTPICMLPSGVQQQFFAAELLTCSKKACSLRLLSVGRMVKEKNLESLLRVATILNEQKVTFTLTLVGYGAEYESLQNYAFQKLKLSAEEVIFVHQPPKDMLVRFYRESDLFLFSSHTDTQGLVLAEAMASALPVIALDGPGQRDIIVQGQNGYIVQSEQEMAMRIFELSKQQDILQSISEDAFKTSQRYSPQFLVRAALDFYKELK